MGWGSFLERAASPHLPPWGVSGAAGGRRDSSRAAQSWRKGSTCHPDLSSWELEPNARAAALPHKRGGEGGWSGKPACGQARGEVSTTLSLQQPQTYKVLVTAPLLRLPPPD